MDINEYISTRLDPQIKWYDEKSVHAQKRYKQFQVVENHSCRVHTSIVRLHLIV